MSRFRLNCHGRTKEDIHAVGECSRRNLSLDDPIVPAVRPAGIPFVGALVIAIASGIILLGLSFLITLGCWRKRHRTVKKIEEIKTVECVLEGSQTDVGPLDDLSLADVEIKSILGKGEFGRVYKGTVYGNLVAVKVVEHQGSALPFFDEPMEALLSMEVHHPNVVRTFWHQTVHKRSIQDALAVPSGSSFVPKSTHSMADIDIFSYMALNLRGNSSDTTAYTTLIVMELCDKGSLNNTIADRFFFHERDKGKPRYASIVLTALDIARAMAYLHGKSIIHGDLKARNVLLMSDVKDERGFRCKVGDFGLSRMVATNTGIQTSTCGTVRYMPPELLKDGRLMPAADVYSFGMLLWELIAGIEPYHKKRNKDIVLDVVNGKRPLLSPEWPSDVVSIIQACWHQDYAQRPCFTQIVHSLEELKCRYAPSSQHQELELLASKEIGMEEVSLGTSKEHEGSGSVGEEGKDADNRFEAQLASGKGSVQSTPKSNGRQKMSRPLHFWERYVLQCGGGCSDYDNSGSPHGTDTIPVPSENLVRGSAAKHPFSQVCGIPIVEGVWNGDAEEHGVIQAPWRVDAQLNRHEHKDSANEMNERRHKEHRSRAQCVGVSASLLGVSSHSLDNNKVLKEPMSWSISSRKSSNY